MPLTCAATGQRSFGSKAGARKANQSNSKRIRVYLCPDCHHFHITKEKIHADNTSSPS